MKTSTLWVHFTQVGSLKCLCVFAAYLCLTQFSLAQVQPDPSSSQEPLLSQELESALRDGRLGDVNGDGLVDSLDSDIILDYDLDPNKVPPEFDKDCADVNGDQVVNTIDALIILSFHRKVQGAEFTLDLETALCEDVGTTGIVFEIFPKAGGPGSPILLTTESPLEGEVGLSVDDIEAEIISVFPSGDSVLALIPEGVRQEQLVKVELTDGSLAGTSFYPIESPAFFAQQPARPPLYILPTGGNMSIAELSYLGASYINLVNVYDADHTLRLPTGNYIPPNPPEDCEVGEEGLTFTELLQGRATCLEIEWEEARIECDIAGNRITRLEVNRAEPGLPDSYRGVFFSSLEEGVLGEGVDLPAGLNTREVFLLLSSLESEQQFLFRVIPDGSAPEQFACFSPPVFDTTFFEPSSGRAPLTVMYGAEATDPDGGPNNGRVSDFTWRFGNGDSTTKQDMPYVYRNPGSYTVTVIAKDNEGDTVSQTFEVFVDSPLVEPNITQFLVAPDSGDLPLLVRFDSDAFDRDGGDIASYEWNVGDGTEPILGQDTSHIYDTAGTFEVVLIVTDDDGQTSERRDTVQVVAPPEVSCEAISDPLRESREVSFVGIASDPDGGDENLTYSWDLGDGNTQMGPSFTHLYERSDTYEVELVVSDDEGQTDTCRTRVVVLEPFQPPVVSCEIEFEGDTAREGTLITFIGEAEDIDGGDIVSYEWDFGDGTTAVGDTVVHAYNSARSYQVELVVTDDEGESATCTDITIGIRVPLTPPVIEVCSLAIGNESSRAPLPVNFFAVARDLDGGQVEYAWDFGDGNSANTANPTHIYETPGSYPITLTVTDNEGEDSICTDLVVTVKVPFAPPRIDLCEAEIIGGKWTGPSHGQFQGRSRRSR